MRQMIRRLSRVADSTSQYEPLQRPQKEQQRRRGESSSSSSPSSATEGRVPVYVGEEMVRFELPAELLNRPAIVELLRRSAEEYGYDQRGVLRIPCPVHHFRLVVAAAAGESARRLSAGEDEELLLSS